MLDFVLVPDGLSANYVRRELSKHSPNGIKVGNFSVLLETLTDLWVLPVQSDNWSDILQASALKMADAFWSKSIQVDEVSVIKQLDQSLRHILKSLPLGQSVSCLENPQTKAERYFNDLVSLHQNMHHVRPFEQQTAKQWLVQANVLSLDSINIYFDQDYFCFDVWQQEVIKALLANQTQVSPNKDLIDSLLIHLAEEVPSDFVALKNVLFTNQPPVSIPEGYKGVLCRDALEECEAVASMVQVASNKGISLDEIAVIYPAGSNYPLWMSKVFEKAGIVVSNLPTYQAIFDWQATLLRDLVVLKSESAPPMAWMSVLSNPLMPWRNHNKRILIIEGKVDDIRDMADEVSEGLIDLLTQKVNDSSEMLEWFMAVIKHLEPLNEQGLTHERMASKLNQLIVWFELYAEDTYDEQCQKILNQLQPKSLNIAGEKSHYLNAVTAVASNETLLKPAKHLFVLGFNQGTYFHNASDKSGRTILNNQAWSLLTEQTGLVLDTFKEEVSFGQTQIKSLLGKAVESLTILASQQDFDGGRLHLSETAFDLALCFMPAEKVNPNLLFSALRDSDHPFLKLTEISIQPEESLVLDDLKLQQNLLALHTVDDGSQRPESPSSFETMMVSPLSWLLDRQGLKDKSWSVEKLDVLLQGTVAHKVFELYKKRQDEPLSDELYEQLFLQAVQEDAAFLQGQQWRLELVQLKQQVKPAFDKFVCWLELSGWRIIGVEKRLKGQIWDIPVKGFADALLKKENEILVLDYKKSKSDDRVKRLKSGFDLQTYIYRELYQQEHGKTDIYSGYYNLNDQVMVLDQAQSSGNEMKIVVPDISVQAQSLEAQNKVQNRLSQLKQGCVELNTNQDSSNWEVFGIKAYALKDNPVVIRFMKEQETETA